MIIDFEDIKLDSYGRLERPTLFIHTLDGKTICPVSNFFNLDCEFRFNDVSEISFDVPEKYIDGVDLIRNDSYDEVRGMRVLRMEPFGSFIILNPEIKDDGVCKVKSCKCYSLEYELNYKNLPSLDSTYMFYDPTGESDNTIIGIILEKIPNWKIGHIDATVATRYRTFDTNGESIYQFMMNTLQSSYSCVFSFDTDNRTINVYDADNAVKNVPLFLSNKNLISQLEAEELSDEIVTCLSVYGANDVSIISVNPNGTDRIYNLDYFIKTGDISKDLADKWNQWKRDNEVYQSVSSNLTSQLYIARTLYNNYSAQMEEKFMKPFTAYKHNLETLQTESKKGGDISDQIAECEKKIAELQVNIDEQQVLLDTQYDKIENIVKSIDTVRQFCAFERYFTHEELNTLNLYFKEDSIQEATYVISYVNDEASLCTEITADNPVQIQITNADLYRNDEYSQLTDEELGQMNLNGSELNELQEILDGITAEHLGAYFFKINSGNIKVVDTNETFDVFGTITNSTLSCSKEPNENNHYNCVISFYINDSKMSNGELDGVTNVLYVVSGEMEEFVYNNEINSSNSDTMSFKLLAGTQTLTYDSTIYQRQNTIQDLYDYGVQTLNKLAYPSYDFSIDSANFMALPEFEHLKKEIKLGRSMNIEFKDGVFLQPVFIGLNMSFDNPESFSLEFSNKFNSNNPEFPLADVIGKTAQSASNLDANKFSYSAFTNSNIQNDVEELITSALDLSKKSIINSNNQSMLIDQSGIHLRKLVDAANNKFDPCEVRLINNQIVFTDDSWETAGLAIGKLTSIVDSVERDFMGVVAQSLIGQVIVGNKLTIEATGMDQVTGQPNVTHFRVDGSGAYLGNASFAIQGKPIDGVEGNKLMFDPNYGLIAGDNTIFDIKSDGVHPNYIDENGDLIYDKTGVMPSGSSLFFDIDSGRLSLRGDIYAENGYFKGRVEATEGFFNGSLNIGDGQFVVDQNGKMTAKDINIADGAKVSGLEVGKNVTMGSDAKISWGQLSDADARVTQITKNTLLTESVTATNLTVTGGTIKLNTDEENYSFIELSYKAPNSNTTRRMKLSANGISIADYADNSTLGITQLHMLGDSMYLKGLTCNDRISANGGITSGSSITPVTGNTYSCGSSSSPWSTVYTGNVEADFMNIRSIVASGTIRADYFGTSSNYATLVHTNNVCIHTSTTTSHAHCGFSSNGYLQEYADNSSKRFKHNITDMSSELIDRIHGLYNLKVKEWIYNDDYIDSEDQLYRTKTFGLIAEDVHEVIPDIIVKDKNGDVKTYRDRHLINAILVLVQEQKKEIDELRLEIKKIKGEN